MKKRLATNTSDKRLPVKLSLYGTITEEERFRVKLKRDEETIKPAEQEMRKTLAKIAGNLTTKDAL